MNPSIIPAGETTLTDGFNGPDANFLNLKPLFGKYHFLPTVRAMKNPVTLGISRHQIEELITKIQATRLVRCADGSFPKAHREDEYNDEYDKALRTWENHFKEFLENSPAYVFELI